MAKMAYGVNFTLKVKFRPLGGHVSDRLVSKRATFWENRHLRDPRKAIF